MIDEPVSAQKPHWQRSVILNPYEIRKHEFSLKGIGLAIHEHRPDDNPDSFSNGCVRHHMSQDTAKASEPQGLALLELQ
jgi:hypothetical protein